MFPFDDVIMNGLVNYAISGLDNGRSPDWPQTIAWINADALINLILINIIVIFAYFFFFD